MYIYGFYKLLLVNVYLEMLCKLL